MVATSVFSFFGICVIDFRYVCFFCCFFIIFLIAFFIILVSVVALVLSIICAFLTCGYLLIFNLR